MARIGTNPDFDSYAATARPFARAIFTHLRGLIRARCPDATEAIKWSYPHFEYSGDVLCIFAAYNTHCAFTFYKDALMSDPRLKANAGLPAAKRFMGRMTDPRDLPPDTDLVAWINEAMALNERGIRLPQRETRTPKVVEVPPALAARLEADPAVKAIFEGKPPSFRKDYCVWIADAKTEATREKRIDAAMSWIADGKARFWKYAKG